MDLGLDGKRCLVTGSTAGIGLEVVRQLAGEGARVVSCGRRHAPGVGEEAHVVADLSHAGEPERVVDETAERLGGLDVLVNNVGIARIARFDEVGDEEWDTLLAAQRHELRPGDPLCFAAPPGRRRLDRQPLVVGRASGPRPACRTTR